MRARVEALLGSSGGALWLGTFHGLAHRLAAIALARGRAPAGLPDSGQRGSAAPDQEGRQGTRARRGALRAARSPVLHQQAQGRGPPAAAAQGRRRSDRAHAAAGSTPSTSRPARAPARSISPSCCCAPSNCGATTPNCSATTARASGTCWSTSSRTPTPSSTSGCACWSGPAATRSWSVTTTSRSTAGAARRSRTCRNSAATSRRRSSTSSSRTIARPPRSLRRPTR